MYRRDAPYLPSWLTYLEAHPDWSSRWRPALRESAVGDPRPFVDDRRSSGNLVHQAYQWCRFEDVTHTRLTDVEFILEFGGGYGALCRLAWALGFRGAYAIYDFPEFSALQRFYLRAHGLPASEEPRAGSDRPGIVTLSTIGELDELLARRRPTRAAFVALWSLSETPPALRDAVLARLSGCSAWRINRPSARSTTRRGSAPCAIGSEPASTGTTCPSTTWPPPVISSACGETSPPLGSPIHPRGSPPRKLRRPRARDRVKRRRP